MKTKKQEQFNEELSDKKTIAFRRETYRMLKSYAAYSEQKIPEVINKAIVDYLSKKGFDVEME